MPSAKRERERLSDKRRPPSRKALQLAGTSLSPGVRSWGFGGTGSACPTVALRAAEGPVAAAFSPTRQTKEKRSSLLSPGY
jgi:hypothetical protein